MIVCARKGCSNNLNEKPEYVDCFGGCERARILSIEDKNSTKLCDSCKAAAAGEDQNTAAASAPTGSSTQAATAGPSGSAAESPRSPSILRRVAKKFSDARSKPDKS